MYWFVQSIAKEFNFLFVRGKICFFFFLQSLVLTAWNNKGIQWITTLSSFWLVSFMASFFSPPKLIPVKLFPCWHSAERVLTWEVENPATSECPGYIWVSSVLWHRGVTYPYCARTGTPLWAPQLALCYRGFQSKSEVRLTHMENHFPFNPGCLPPLCLPPS